MSDQFYHDGFLIILGFFMATVPWLLEAWRNAQLQTKRHDAAAKFHADMDDLGIRNIEELEPRRKW